MPKSAMFLPDSFAFHDAPDAAAVSLLLPAVQKAETGHDALDAFAVAPEEGETALLLPAVQMVREAARSTAEAPFDDFAARAGVEPTPFTLVELLVV